MANLFSNFKSVMYKNYGENPGKMLVHTGVLGWILSAMAQVSAVVFNDKISKEQKSFLIPQEIADAAINIISFYVITSSFKNLASKLVSTGKLSTVKMRNYIKSKVANPADYIGKLNTADLDLDIYNNYCEIDEIVADRMEFKNEYGNLDIHQAEVGRLSFDSE